MSHNLFWEWDSVILNPLSDNEKQNLMELMKKIAFSEDGGLDMEQLNKFISLLTGRFHNSEQYETMKKNGIEFPLLNT